MTKFYVILAMLISAALFCVAVVASHVVYADAVCITVDKVKSDITAAIPTAHMVELGGNEAQAFMGIFNAFPPATSFVADYVLTLQDDKKPLIALVLFNHGCFVRVHFVSKEQFKKIMSSI